MVLENSLRKAGLTAQEAKVYLNTLKLGVAKASEIAKKALIKREASYYILKMLQEKGFISEVVKSGVKHYSAIQPKKIINLIKEEQREKAEAITNILPELDSLQKIAITRPTVEFYEGKDGFKTITSKLLDYKNIEIYCYVTEKILEFLPTFHLQFRRKRREKNIKIKLITEKTRKMLEIQKNDKKELRETRFNNKLTKKIDTAFFILPDAIVIIKANQKEQIGIYIKEKLTAELQRRVFEELWSKL